MFIFVNGELVEKESARISPFDHGFLYGVGLFETFRVYDGHPFLLDDHLARLQKGLEELKITYKTCGEHVDKILKELLQVNGLKDAYVRFNVSAGIGDLGLQVGEYQKPNVIVFMKEIPPFQDERQAVILKTPRNTPEGDSRLKSHHFLNNIYGKREIGNNPAAEGIFQTKEGFIAEGITSTIFWVKENILYTPALETGILNGITRAFVILLAKRLGIEVKEGLYKEDELLACEEAFITNSIQEIVPLYQINQVMLPKDNQSITNKLMSIYSAYRKSLWSMNELTERN